jgi:hypothetical protein
MFRPSPERRTRLSETDIPFMISLVSMEGTNSTCIKIPNVPLISSFGLNGINPQSILVYVKRGTL